MKADYPKDPVHPGQEFTITGHFDSSTMPVAEYQKRFAVVVQGERFSPSLAMNVKVVE
jgi:hypothetical protein